MIAAPLSPKEEERLETLTSYDILDTEPEEEYDELTELASAICGTPISLISLVDAHRQWFKSKVGVDADETSRDVAFCAHAILQKDVFVVEDTLKDKRFFDNPLVTSDPNIRFYAGVPLYTGKGHALGTLCVIDREPRQLTDEQAKSLMVLGRQVVSQIEIRLLLKKVQAYAVKLKELNATKDKLFSVISHDLRAPFNGIISLSEMLIEDFDSTPPEECRSMVEDIHESGQIAFNLLENLLTWARCETGQIKMEPVSINVQSLTEEVFKLLSGVAGEKSLELSVSGADGIEVFADRNMIHSILQNLISNATKFTPTGGHITVNVSGKESMVAIDVIDNGVGMDETQVQQIMSSGNTQSTVGTAGESGTGVGLVLCKQFTEKNGGTFSVSSKKGEGSIFRLMLPGKPV